MFQAVGFKLLSWNMVARAWLLIALVSHAHPQTEDVGQPCERTISELRDEIRVLRKLLLACKTEASEAGAEGASSRCDGCEAELQGGLSAAGAVARSGDCITGRERSPRLPSLRALPSAEAPR